MTAQTTTQRTAKHRLAVKERMARYEGALEEIAALPNGLDIEYAASIAKVALDPTIPYREA